MIKNFVKIEIPKINLGNLGLHNACSFYVDKDPDNFPISWFGKKTKTGEIILLLPGRPSDCPRGYCIKEQFDSPQEELVDYASQLKEEHSDLSNTMMKEASPFFGRKRSARWEDEKRRRGLIR